MEPLRESGRIRVVLSTLAAIVATLICVVQRHVQIVLSEPRTYASPLYHKCGLLMIACVAWAVFEIKRYFLPSILPHS